MSHTRVSISSVELEALVERGRRLEIENARMSRELKFFEVCVNDEKKEKEAALEIIHEAQACAKDAVQARKWRLSSLRMQEMSDHRRKESLRKTMQEDMQLLNILSRFEETDSDIRADVDDIFLHDS